METLTLTRQQIAKIFAPYIGQDVLMWNKEYNSESGTRTFMLTRVGTERCSGYFNEDGDYISPKTNYCVDSFLLKLKPFSKITDEDAVALAKILFPGNSKYDFKRSDRSIEFEIDSEGSTDKPVYLRFDLGLKYKDWFRADHYYADHMSVAYQYLISKGYAVPLFIEENHPDNGKTALELEVAVE